MKHAKTGAPLLRNQNVLKRDQSRRHVLCGKKPKYGSEKRGFSVDGIK